MSSIRGQKQDFGTQMPRREEDWGMTHPLRGEPEPQVYSIKYTIKTPPAAQRRRMGDSSERREALPATSLVGQGPNLGLATSVPILGFSRTIRYKTAFLRLKTGPSGPR